MLPQLDVFNVISLHWNVYLHLVYSLVYVQHNHFDTDLYKWSRNCCNFAGQFELQLSLIILQYNCVYMYYVCYVSCWLKLCVLSPSGTGEEPLQNAHKWEYVLFFFFFHYYYSSHILYLVHSNWCVSLHKSSPLTLTLLTHTCLHIQNSNYIWYIYLHIKRYIYFLSLISVSTFLSLIFPFTPTIPGTNKPLSPSSWPFIATVALGNTNRNRCCLAGLLYDLADIWTHCFWEEGVSVCLF